MFSLTLCKADTVWKDEPFFLLPPPLPPFPESANKQCTTHLIALINVGINNINIISDRFSKIYKLPKAADDEKSFYLYLNQLQHNLQIV